MSSVQIPEKESLRVEFKSDMRKLSDQDLVLAAVCLANTEGGEIYLGVEDDGRVSGVHREHQDITGLAALIANRTVPPLSVRTALLDVEDRRVVRIDVPHSPRLVAASNGTLQRRRLLADAFKRLGLAERTGRGVDLIYQGVLRYGRPAPSYARSDATSVVVELSCTPADVGFLKLVVEQEQRQGRAMPIDTLLLLDRLRRERRVEVAQAAVVIQKDVAAARGVLERLVEAGLVEAHGVTRGRTYTLSATLYKEIGESIGYVRQLGFDRLQQEQMVQRYVDQHGIIRRREVMELCTMSRDQASRLLQNLVAQGVLVRHGERKGAFYGRA